MTRLALIALVACAPKAVAPPVPPPAPAPPPAVPPAAPPAEPVDPAPVTDGDVTDAWVHGMHVLVKRTPGAESAATHLYIRGGVRNWGADDAGVEYLAIRASVTGGTEALTKDAFTRRLAELGSAVDGFANEDYAVASAWSLTPAWDNTFALLVDAFRRPALRDSQIELARTRQLAALRHEQETPDGRLGLLVRGAIYRGHPYEHRAIGTLDTVPRLTAAALRAHLAKLRETSRLLLVVVGDVEPARVIAAADATLGDLPRGDYRDPPLPGWTADRGAATVVDAKLPTTYVQAVVPGPRWRDADFAVAIVCMNALAAREFREVRTKRNLSYAPAAYLNTGGDLPLAGLYVTAVDPATTLRVMFDEARRMRDEPLADHELAGVKSTVITSIFTGAEAPGDQAVQLARAQLFTGDWHAVRTLADRVRAVTAAQVQAWAAKRLTHFQSFVIGDGSKLDRPALEAF